MEPEAKTHRIHDKLINLISGLGASGDKSANTQHYYEQKSTSWLANFYAGNWMARKVVDLPIDDMMSKPRVVSLADDEIKPYNDEITRLKLNKKLYKLFSWSRLYGGAVLVLGVDGAGEADTELKIESVTKGSLAFIHVLSRSEVTVMSINNDVLSPSYNEPLSYSIKGRTVHASRVIPLAGLTIPDDLDDSSSNKVFGISALETMEDPINHASTVLAQLASMVFEANVDTVGVKGLGAKLANKTSKQQLIDRFRVGNMMKSSQQMMLYDMDNEEYKRNPSSLAGFDAMVPQYLSVVSGASGIPATRFLGKSPDGMNATGEGDDRIYLDKIKNAQETDLTEVFSRLDPILLRSAYGRMPENFSYEFPNLWNLDKKEESEISNKDADTCLKYLDMGVIQEHHVADKLQKDGFFPSLTEEEVEAMKNANNFDQSDDLDIGEDENGEYTIPTEEGATPIENSLDAPAEASVQAQALNGAQISSLVDISSKVASGDLSRESGISIVMTAVPSITREQASLIVGEYNPALAPNQTLPVIPTPQEVVTNEED